MILVLNFPLRGVYLRGMYEAQVVDRDSRMQRLQGGGSFLGRSCAAKERRESAKRRAGL